MRKTTCLLSVIFLLLMSCAQAGNNAESDGGSAAPGGKIYLHTTFWGTSLTITWIYLGADGTLIRDPKHGVDPVDVAAEMTDNATNVGTYKVGAKMISVKWKNGKTEEWTFEKTNGEYSSLYGGLTTLQKPLPTNYTLDGKFMARAATANLTSTSTLLFTKDGKFKEANVGTVSTAETGAIAKNNVNGTYKITGNTLRMNYADGKKAISVVTVMNIGNKKHLVIDGSFYPQQ